MERELRKRLNIGLAVALISVFGLIFATARLPGAVTAHGIDGDGDLYSPEDGDCNDEDPSIFPGAVEIPDDGIDQNCDGAESSGIALGILVGGIAAVIIVFGAAGWYVRRLRKSKQQTHPRARRRRR